MNICSIWRKTERDEAGIDPNEIVRRAHEELK